MIAAVVGFAGTYNPEVEADFTVIGQANEASGWKRYSHTATLDTGSNGEVWVAVGISVRWETEMVYIVDDVKSDNKLEKPKSIFEADDILNEILVISRKY